MKSVVEKVGSDDGATRLPEEYKELEKVLCVLYDCLLRITTGDRCYPKNH